MDRPLSIQLTLLPVHPLDPTIVPDGARWSQMMPSNPRDSYTLLNVHDYCIRPILFLSRTLAVPTGIKL